MKDNASSCAQRADGMDTEAAQRAKKGERERKREAPKERLSEGQEKKRRRWRRRRRASQKRTRCGTAAYFPSQ